MTDNAERKADGRRQKAKYGASLVSFILHPSSFILSPLRPPSPLAGEGRGEGAKQRAEGKRQKAKYAPRTFFWRKLTAILVIAYALAIVALWLWMYREGDRSWLATLFLFGPRWVCALPLLVLVPLVALANRRMLSLLAITGVIILGPILGFELHFADTSGQAALRVLTLNVNQSSFDPARFAEVLARTAPDVVALQEVAGIPPKIVWPPGWHVVYRDEFIVASRFPVVVREGMLNPRIPGKRLAFRYTIERPGGAVELFNLHLATPRDGLEAVLDRELGLDTSQIPALEAMLAERGDETRAVSQWIAKFPGPKIVVGDFNTPVESTIYRANWSGLDNAFSAAGLGLGFTKITEKEGTSYGARIDHVLYTPPWRSVRAWVDHDIGSDHLPLVAEFE